jgi:ribosomal protein S21
LKKPFTKKGLVEWLKVYNLSSNPSTAKKKKKKKTLVIRALKRKKCGATLCKLG